MCDINVFYTNHYINKTVTQYLAKSQNLTLDRIENYQKNNKKIFCSYGILRGTGEVFKNTKNFVYIDHGYFAASKRKFTENKTTLVSDLSGYFRVIKNDLYFNKNFNINTKERFDRLGIKLKDLNTNGKHIILSEPSEYILNFLNIPNWTNDTLSKIKQFTDREIIIHNKFSKIPLKNLMEEAFAFVSCQSTAGYMAISEGVPAYFTHESLTAFGDISMIEDRSLNHNLLYIAANSQFQLNEFFSSDFKEYFNTITK